MICDNFRQVGGLCPFRNNRRRIRDVSEQRTIRKERAACDEDDARIRSSIAREIGRCNGAAIVKHDVENHDFGLMFAEKIDSFGLAGDHLDVMTLTFQMTRPDVGKLAVRSNNEYQF